MDPKKEKPDWKSFGQHKHRLNNFDFESIKGVISIYFFVIVRKRRFVCLYTYKYWWDFNDEFNWFKVKKKTFGGVDFSFSIFLDLIVYFRIGLVTFKGWKSVKNSIETFLGTIFWFKVLLIVRFGNERKVLYRNRFMFHGFFEMTE